MLLTLRGMGNVIWHEWRKAAHYEPNEDTKGNIRQAVGAAYSGKGYENELGALSHDFAGAGVLYHLLLCTDVWRSNCL